MRLCSSTTTASPDVIQANYWKLHGWRITMYEVIADEFMRIAWSIASKLRELCNIMIKLLCNLEEASASRASDLISSNEMFITIHQKPWNFFPSIFSFFFQSHLKAFVLEKVIRRGIRTSVLHLLPLTIQFGNFWRGRKSTSTAGSR